MILAAARAASSAERCTSCFARYSVITSIERAAIPIIATMASATSTIVTPRFTKWGERTVTAHDGSAVLPDDVIVMAVIHRHGKADPTPRLAILEDWGAWLTKDDVLNTRTWKQIQKLQKKR